MESERRLHPLSFIFAILNTAKQFVFPLLVGLFAARGRDTWELWTGVVLVPLALVSLGRALSVRYRFEPTELVIRSGFVFRRVRHIPYDRVQNVDAVQNVLHRVFGVIEVRVETGGGVETEAALQVVDRQALDEIRARVFAGRRGAAAEEEAAAASQDVLLAMPPREVFLFGLIHGRGMIVAGALFGLLWEFGLTDRVAGTYFGEGSSGRGFVRQLARGLFDDVAVSVPQLLVGVVTLFLLLAVFRVASALWTSLEYYGFTVTRVGDDLRCEYGLLRRVTSTIPVRRIQTLIVRESPWHRLGRRLSVGVQTAGGKAIGQDESTRSWLAPLVRRSDLVGLLEQIVPGATADVPWQPVHARGVRRLFVLSLGLLLPVMVPVAAVAGWWAAPVLAILAGWAYLHARRSIAAMRWTVSGGTVQFARGWIWRNRLVAPLTKIQAVARHESPFDRRHGMATVFADTAGRALGEHALRIPYLAAPVARTLAERLSNAAAQTAFRW